MLKLPTVFQKLKFTPLYISILAAILWCAGTQFIRANTYQVHIGMGLIFSAAVISYFLGKKIHWYVGACFFYFSVSAIPRTVFPAVYWPQAIPEPGVLVGFESLVEGAYIYLTLIVMAFLFLRKYLKYVEDFFLALGIIDAIVLCAKFIFMTVTTHKFNDFWYYFVMNNASIDASFLACVLPIAFSRYQKNWTHKIILALLIAPCIFTYSSSGIMGLGLAIGMYIWSKNKFSLSATIYGGAASLSVAMIGWLIQSQGLLASSGRSHIWKLGITYWLQNDIKAFGSGMGTWYMIGPALQMNEATSQGQDMIDAFFWMHNDWLQVAIEHGLTGLALVIGLFGLCVFRARHVPKIFASCVVLGSLAFIQMPLRHFILTIMGAYLVTSSLSTPAKSEPQCTDK